MFKAKGLICDILTHSRKSFDVLSWWLQGNNEGIIHKTDWLYILLEKIPSYVLKYCQSYMFKPSAKLVTTKLVAAFIGGCRSVLHCKCDSKSNKCCYPVKRVMLHINRFIYLLVCHLYGCRLLIC